MKVRILPSPTYIRIRATTPKRPTTASHRLFTVLRRS